MRLPPSGVLLAHASGHPAAAGKLAANQPYWRRLPRPPNAACLRAADALARHAHRPRAAHCQNAGAIVHAEVARQSSGRSKGWALVDYATPADAAQVRGGSGRR